MVEIHFSNLLMLDDLESGLFNDLIELEICISMPTR